MAGLRDQTLVTLKAQSANGCGLYVGYIWIYIPVTYGLDMDYIVIYTYIYIYIYIYLCVWCVCVCMCGLSDCLWDMDWMDIFVPVHCQHGTPRICQHGVALGGLGYITGWYFSINRRKGTVTLVILRGYDPKRPVRDPWWPIMSHRWPMDAYRMRWSGSSSHMQVANASRKFMEWEIPY